MVGLHTYSMTCVHMNYCVHLGFYGIKQLLLMGTYLA